MPGHPIQVEIDAFLPPVIAARMEAVGAKKANQDFATTLILAILAGAFVAAGALFATTVTAGVDTKIIGYGVVKLLAGLVFCLGLVAVIVAGAELFTGNNLIIMALASGKTTVRLVLRNWVIVYVGNFIGAILTAAIMLVSKQYTFGGGAIGASALSSANAKCNLDFLQAVALGIMCNALVCLAVWLAASARSTTDKILAVIFPVTAFVAAGFEHSVANMYFIPMALFIKATAAPGFWEAIGHSPADYPNLDWVHFAGNLLPVTIGNIIGGVGLVGLVYWYIFLRPLSDQRI